MKDSRGSIGCIVVGFAAPLITALLWMILIVRPERLALEEKLMTEFASKLGGEPTFVERDSKHSTWDYFLETFQGPKAYYVRLLYADCEYHAYVRKTRDWEIQTINRRGQGSDGKPDPVSS